VIPISRPFLGDEELEAVQEPLRSGWVVQGPYVADFEAKVAAFCGVEHAVATTSCTTALHVAVSALGLGPGDEVLVPAFTWVSTANVVEQCGARAVFVDVDLESFNVDAGALGDAVTDRTVGVIPVHLFGRAADMPGVRAVAERHGLWVLEDAACALGTRQGGVHAGALGDAGCFSFHPRKSITTGEGGMVTTADDRLARRVNSLRNHGAEISEEARHVAPKPYVLSDFNLLGFNYRMTDLQGAVGLVQLKKLDHYIDERQRWADYYRRELAGLKWLRMPEVPAGWRHGWQSFVCTVQGGRNDVMESLMQAGINTRPGTHAVHMLRYYRERFGLQPGDFPAARDADGQSMAIPLHNRMSEHDYGRVVRALREIR